MPERPAQAANASAEERLLAAVTELCAREGYGSLTVEKLLRTARVSRATFYEYFEGTEECLLGAYRTEAAALLEQLGSAPAAGPRELTALDVLLELAQSRPGSMMLLAREGLAAGPPLLRERDALISSLGSFVAAGPRAARAVDLPPALLFGGVLRFLSIGLSNGPLASAQAEEIRQWALALTRPTERGLVPRLAPAIPEATGRRRLPTGPLPRSLSVRERLLRATAIVLMARGYRVATVADIAAVAGTSRRLFYRHFNSKRDAYIASYEHAFAQTVAASAPAFFAPGSWPERVWSAARAFTGFFASEPAFAHLGFVECYALGSSFLTRVNETQLAFTIFLEEGYHQNARAASLPHSFSGLTAATVFEAGFLACRAGASLYLRRLQPLVVYVVLSPFLGPEEAERFVSRKLERR